MSHVQNGTAFTFQKRIAMRVSPAAGLSPSIRFTTGRRTGSVEAQYIFYLSVYVTLFQLEILALDQLFFHEHFFPFDYRCWIPIRY
jgi:hypothetical protein